ncbi:MAG: hypothetical protein QOH75_116 [Actinomycetota bacterium]|jgi:hypothetical protein|nr:hypothetical protein [Actinomycetota bacterium]MDQ1668623.1 hypothetical protein [Actinomycetota bacterium]
MDALAALVPPVVVAGAFIAIAIAVKRFNDREESQDRRDDRD